MLHVHKPHHVPDVVTHGLSISGASMQLPHCRARLELETRAKPGCSAVYPINHRQHGFSISSHCTSMGVMAVGLVRLFGDGDAVTARAGHWPGRLYLLCAHTTESVPLPDALALALLPQKSPPVTIRSPHLSHFSLTPALKKHQPCLRPEVANFQF